MSGVSMTCGRARRVLWPDGGPRPASPEVIGAQAHLAGCSACQEFVRDMRALGDAVREAAPREQAPAEVRDRVFAAVARARTSADAWPRRGRRPRARVVWLAAAGVLLAALGGALTLWRSSHEVRVDPIAALAEDHSRATSETHIASGDPTEVTRWLGRQVHFAMHVPVLPGARLRGARLCVTDGRRGAAVEYEVDGVAVSYFVVPDGARDAPSAGSSRFDRTRRAGYQIVSWREPGLLHAMVGDLPASRLATLAEACVEQARRMVAWLGGRAYGHEQEHEPEG